MYFIPLISQQHCKITSSDCKKVLVGVKIMPNSEPATVIIIRMSAYFFICLPYSNVRQPYRHRLQVVFRVRFCPIVFVFVGQLYLSVCYADVFEPFGRWLNVKDELRMQPERNATTVKNSTRMTCGTKPPMSTRASFTNTRTLRPMRRRSMHVSVADDRYDPYHLSR